MKKIIGTLLLSGAICAVSHAAIIADLAGDYVDDTTLASGWGYFYSDAATGGTEVALTANVAVGQEGQVGFGGGISFGVPAIDGSNDNGGNFELFSNGQSANHDAVVGTHMLMHAGQQGNSADYTIARYTISTGDISANGTTASIETLFQSFAAGGGSTGTDFEVYHNTTALVAVDGGTSGDFTGVNAPASFTVAAGDTVSFVIGNNTNFGGSESAVFGQLSVIPEPATLGLVAVFGGGILFVRRRLKV